MLNLFAAASKGPLSDESLRKISAYSDSIKQQKADELLEKADSFSHRAMAPGAPHVSVPPPR